MISRLPLQLQTLIKEEGLSVKQILQKQFSSSPSSSSSTGGGDIVRTKKKSRHNYSIIKLLNWSGHNVSSTTNI